MDAETVKTYTDLLQLASADTTLKKVSSSGGGEWAGPCPFCGGTDRFRVQPYRENGGKWYCRGCGEGHWHDAIDYIERRNTVDFIGAMDILSNNTPQQEKTIPVDKSRPADVVVDLGKWIETSKRFIDSCIDILWNGSTSAKVLDYLHGRGLTDDTLREWEIGYHPDEGYGNPDTWGMDAGASIYLPRGIVIPAFVDSALHYVKIRKGSGEPKYFILKGGQQFLFGAGTYRGVDTAYLFESELDVLLAWQSGLKLGFGSTPAGQPLRETYSPFFADILDLIIAYDNDPPGQEAAAKISSLSPHFYQVSPFPNGGKDLTEYYQRTGSFEAVVDWLLETLKLTR